MVLWAFLLCVNNDVSWMVQHRSVSWSTTPWFTCSPWPLVNLGWAPLGKNTETHRCLIRTRMDLRLVVGGLYADWGGFSLGSALVSYRWCEVMIMEFNGSFLFLIISGWSPISALQTLFWVFRCRPTYFFYSLRPTHIFFSEFWVSIGHFFHLVNLWFVSRLQTSHP